MAKKQKDVNVSYETVDCNGDIEWCDTLAEALESASEGDEILEVSKKRIGYAKVNKTLSKEQE